ncbi:hypothetical protein FA95DRAFT_1565444 [Auriscalpium vulgare]|uniref:Uncharacterized protein n=1 Tax=Auriscalpium vulgare TaxID=40419 RepID=A0ACB8RBX5_9AGAM|nr:hypothetical protein FA95DRAFT_1565444 [Auriscalpium vulgare]
MSQETFTSSEFERHYLATPGTLQRSERWWRRRQKALRSFCDGLYYLGNLMRERFVQKCYGFQFLEPLVADMCCEEPSKRLKIGAAVARFKDVRSGLGAWKLRSRVVSRKEYTIVGLIRGTRHVYRTARDIALRRASIPDP